MYMCMYMWLCDTEITVSASNSLINLHVLAADLTCILRKRLTSYVPVGMCACGGKKNSQVLLERGDYNAVHIPSGICKSNTYWPEAVMFQAAQHGFLPAVSWHSLGQHEAPWRVAGSHCFNRSGNSKAGDRRQEHSAVSFLKSWNRQVNLFKLLLLGSGHSSLPFAGEWWAFLSKGPDLSPSLNAQRRPPSFGPSLIFYFLFFFPVRFIRRKLLSLR